MITHQILDLGVFDTKKGFPIAAQITMVVFGTFGPRIKALIFWYF